jgi:hypothetical protein
MAWRSRMRRPTGSALTAAAVVSVVLLGLTAAPVGAAGAAGAPVGAAGAAGAPVSAAGATGAPVGAAPPTATSWRIQPSPSHVRSYNFLSSVSCPARPSCVAVGRYSTAAGTDVPLTMVRSGRRWRLVATPALNGARYAQLSSVSCTRSTWCMAVGFVLSSSSAGTERALVERWNGETWKALPSPVPAGKDPAGMEVGLAGVSCPGPRVCLAVGAYVRSGVNVQAQPLAETWNGSSWSLVSAPNPRAENGSGFTATDCTGIDRCETVGFYDYGDVDQAATAYSWNGATWSAQDVVNPGGQSVNTLTSVGCTAANACASVGSWTGDFPLSLAERWDGTSWVRQSIANPPAAVTDDLAGVDCPGANLCVAVGSWANNGNDYPSLPLTAEWDGTAWSLTRAAVPAGANAALAAVSCPPAGACVAVGASEGSTPGADTLVEVQQR